MKLKTQIDVRFETAIVDTVLELNRAAVEVPDLGGLTGLSPREAALKALWQAEAIFLMLKAMRADAEPERLELMKAEIEKQIASMKANREKIEGGE
ncbi:hypothetical protein [Burkholderia gladioli]|uniref:hypothetical protein n=1 Tax=Burkholderia gladioli TaxID=28095 RepID=UPI00164099FD|nr:hypothetical protein [Burkholderia gladioli]